MRAAEPMRGLRVVATARALDDARWQGDAITVLRTAPDEVLALGATGADVDDEHAIVEPESGMVGWRLAAGELASVVVSRLEWPLPVERPALAQGFVAGVPAKLWLPVDGEALLLTAAPFAAELRERLG